MKRFWPLLAAGVIVSLVGLVWALQGFNILGGSAMSGSSVWAAIGPFVFLVGLIVIAIAIAAARRRREKR